MRSPSRSGARTCCTTGSRGLDEAARTLAVRAADAQRFERETAAVAETFVSEGDAVRRLVLVGMGGAQGDDALYERVGGALTARLLTSGETRLVVDLTGLELSARDAARIGFGAAARSWRYDLYRTKLGRKQKPTLAELVIVGAPAGVEKEWAHEAGVLEGLNLTRKLVTEPANIIYPESFVERCREAMESAASSSRCSTRRRWPSSAWARCSASPRARSARRGCWSCAGTAANRAPSRSSSSARASPSTPAASRSSRRSAWKR